MCSQASSETIETLNIGHNAITNEGAHLLKDGLLKTNSLLRLGLQGTRISDEGKVFTDLETLLYTLKVSQLIKDSVC